MNEKVFGIADVTSGHASMYMMIIYSIEYIQHSENNCHMYPGHYEL